MGRQEAALAQMRANVDAWTRAIDDEGLEAIVVTTSGCGATIKDYRVLLADDPPTPTRRRGWRRWRAT